MKTREQVSLALIEDNPWQPRREIDQDELQKLADSIYQLGLLQAPLGRRHPEVSGRIQLAFGHRRVAALRLLLQQGRGEMYVEMDVAGISDEGMAVLALTENERRKQLSQIEVVRAHYKAIDETNLTIQTLADQLDIDRSTLSNHLRVLDLPDFVLQHVESGKLRVSVAREFLVFQTATHQHTEDMQEVIRRIVNVETYGGGVPDWRRRHVRKMVSEAVSYNEKDWRPLGPPTAHSTGGGNRVASFDRDDFVWEFRDSLHTIPADDGHVENYQRSERYDKSRQWTCEAKEWSRRQSRATREANQEVEARGGSAPAASSKSASRDKHFEVVLAKDPVFKQVATSRAKKGPSRPVNDEERAQLGTRAEMRDVSGNTGFWKILEKGELDGRQNKYAWSREGGGGPRPAAGTAPTASSKSASRDKHFEVVLAKDTCLQAEMVNCPVQRRARVGRSTMRNGRSSGPGRKCGTLAATPASGRYWKRGSWMAVRINTPGVGKGEGLYRRGSLTSTSASVAPSAPRMRSPATATPCATSRCAASTGSTTRRNCKRVRQPTAKRHRRIKRVLTARTPRRSNILSSSWNPSPTTPARYWLPRWSPPTLRWPGPIRSGSTMRTGATSPDWGNWCATCWARNHWLPNTTGGKSTAR